MKRYKKRKIYKNPFKPWMSYKQIRKVARTKRAQRWAGFSV